MELQEIIKKNFGEMALQICAQAAEIEALKAQLSQLSAQADVSKIKAVK